MANRYLKMHKEYSIFMHKLKINAYAKINLTLDVLGKRSDGYHELSSIMQTVNLADVITITEAEQGIKIISSSSDIPVDEKNLAYQAAALLLNKGNVSKGVIIELEKNIPVMAGLAGGSADAAATLNGLNKMWQLNLTSAELWQLAIQLGSDVAFCLEGGTCLAEGRGEILTKLVSPPPIWTVIAKPKLSVSTALVYKNFNQQKVAQRPNNAEMIRYLKEGNTEKIAEQLVNVLESVTLPMHPILKVTKEKMKEMGALGVLMSGSGPTIFAFTANREIAQIIAESLEKDMEAVFITTTLS